MLTIDEETLDDLLERERRKAEVIDHGTEALDHEAYACGLRDGAEDIHRGILREAK